MAFRWPPTRDMGGALSLTVIPTAQEYQYCGFDFLIPYDSAGVRETLIDTVGAKVIPSCAQGTRVWGDEKGVVGYFLDDDTKFDYDLVKGWYDRAKAKTNKPVGSVFWRPPHDTDRNRLINISNFLDFILVYTYPYYEWSDEAYIDDKIDYMIRLANDLKCPVMLGAQGMDTGRKNRIDPDEAGLRHQYERYYAGGYAVWWYCWARGGSKVDIKRKYQYLMHDFYGGVAPPSPEPDLAKLRQEIAILEEKIKQLREKIQTIIEKIKSIKALLGKE